MIGFAVIWLIGAEMQITKIAVAPSFQKLGVASWTMSLIFDQARLLDVTEAFVEVRSSNESAIHLYKKFGFIVQGQRKHYYRAPQEDALLMTATI